MKVNPKHGEHAGQTILEMLEEQLDVQYAALMEIREAGESWSEDEIAELLGDSKEDHANAAQIVKHLQQKGKVAGLAYAIAKFRNPYKPDMDAIRKAVAARYEEREEEDDD